jgi:hypothetical protein
VWSLLEDVLPRCRNLRGVVLERFDGSFDWNDVPALEFEIRRAHRLWEASAPARASAAADAPRTVPAVDLPPGGNLAMLLATLFLALRHPNALAALRDRDPPEAMGEGFRRDARALREFLVHVDPDGLALTSVLVRKLRWERLLRGAPELAQAFEKDPQGFVERWRRYEAEVPPTAYFPIEEAELWWRWLRVLPDEPA